GNRGSDLLRQRIRLERRRRREWLERSPQFSGEIEGPGAPADNDVAEHHAPQLAVRHVDGTRWNPAEASRMDVSGDSHDLEVALAVDCRDQMMADGVLPGEIRVRILLVDDRDGRALLSVAIGELAAGDEADVERAEEARAGADEDRIVTLGKRLACRHGG